MRPFLVSTLLLALLGAACSTSSKDTSADAKPVLVDVANDVILPTYRAADVSADALRAAVKALEAAPSATTLTAAQTAWRAARKDWHQGEAFRFGPVNTKEISGAIDYWPARGATIDTVITGPSEISAASFAALGANARGYQAIEYVLFDSAAGDAAVLERLTTDPAAKRRLLYLVTAAEHLKGKTSELYAAWDPAAGNFARELTEAGSGAALFPSAKSAVDQLVNSTVFSVDLVTGTKIGKPYGTKSGGNPVADQEEAPRSDNSIADMLDTLEGAKNVYVGKGGKGLSELVRTKNPALDTRVLALIEDARVKIAAIPPPFRIAITAQRPAVEAAYLAMRALKNALQTEVTGALATTLQFNDNDGD